MDMLILPGRLSGTVGAIPSKSQAHRALLCAALADAPTCIGCEGESGDITATAACLSALGAEITRGPGGYTVRPLAQRTDIAASGTERSASTRTEQDAATRTEQDAATKTEQDAATKTEHNVETQAMCSAAARPESQAPVPLPCGESGSTLRFLLPVVGALGRDVAFLPEGRLPLRPLSPLYEELVRHGSILSPQGAVPFRATGRLRPGSYVLDAGVSSQFVSGLLFALPLLGGDSTLQLTGRVESWPYIGLTLAMLEMFNIRVEWDGSVFSIPGGQAYRSPGVAQVEGDWSNAAFWLCAGAVAETTAGTTAGTTAAADTVGDAGDSGTIVAGAASVTSTAAADTVGAASVTSTAGITCSGLDLRSRQGDRAVLDILRRFGARVGENAETVTVSGGALRSLEIDAGDIPDLVPILAVVAAAAEGTTVFRHAQRLRAKESDRLASVTALLRGLGADAHETEDGLRIRGGAALTGGEVSSRGDHRIAMAAAIAATMCTAPVILRDAEAVGKSYPGFFEVFRSLGGKTGSADCGPACSVMPDN